MRDERGSARRLRCQYHSWTYEVDGGTLVSVPDERDFVDFDPSLRCLPQASCDTFAGFVFVNRDLAAPPLLEWLGPVTDMLEPFQGEHLREVYRESRIVPCNWKVTAEAFLEVYHFRHIHSHDGVSVLDNRGAAMGLYPQRSQPDDHPVLPPAAGADGDGRLGRLAQARHRNAADDRHRPGDGRVHELGGRASSRTRSSRSVRSGSRSTCSGRSTSTPRCWSGSTTRPAPDGADRFDPDDLPEHWQQRRRQYNQIMAEDELNMAPIHSSMTSPALTGLRINYQERRIWHLHEEIDRVIGRERIPSELRLEPLLDPYLESHAIGS